MTGTTDCIAHSPMAASGTRDICLATAALLTESELHQLTRNPGPSRK